MSEYTEVAIEDDNESYLNGSKKIEKELIRLISNPSHLGRYDKIMSLLKEYPKYLTEKLRTKDKKLRSLYTLIKYEARLNSKEEQRILLNLVFDMGYKKFQFSSKNKDYKKHFKSLLFAAVNGDLANVNNIINYFAENKKINILHNTMDGDTIIAFMIKFGDPKQENFPKCVQLIVDRVQIDCNRLDYYKHDVDYILRKEKEICVKKDSQNAEVVFEEVERIIKQAKFDSQYSLQCNKKLKIFNEMIRNKDIKEILTKDIVDEDDGENTLLQLAIVKNNIKTVQILLKLGADPNRIVEGGNEMTPLAFAFMVNRIDIFKEILKNNKVEITNETLNKLNDEYLKLVLESGCPAPILHYGQHSILYHAIRLSSYEAIDKLLYRGATLTEDCLKNINPKDLEHFLDSNVKFDNYRSNMEDYNFRLFIDFTPFFITNNCGGYFRSEIEILRKLSRYKRLKYLVEHPIMRVMMVLKWESVKYYYYCFTTLKCLFYFITVFFMFIGQFSMVISIILTLVQGFILIINAPDHLSKGRLTLHFTVEFFLLVLFIILSTTLSNVFVYQQITSLTAILMSVSLLLTLGYHLSLSTSLSLTARLAFSLAFHTVLTAKQDTMANNNETTSNSTNEDERIEIFSSIFRIFVLLSGDIGNEEQLSSIGSYIVFVLFCVGMAIIVMNFWTGVAVSDIKEIEEQSTIAAFTNVIVYIQTIERMYYYLLICSCCSNKLYDFLIKIQPSFKSKIKVCCNKKGNQQKPEYGLSLYINKDLPLQRTCEAFKYLEFDEELRRDIKQLKTLDTNEILQELKSKMDEILQTKNTLKLLSDRLEKMENVLKNFSS